VDRLAEHAGVFVAKQAAPHYDIGHLALNARFGI
jgi:hypothetical protein